MILEVQTAHRSVLRLMVLTAVGLLVAFSAACGSGDDPGPTATNAPDRSPQTPSIDQPTINLPTTNPDPLPVIDLPEPWADILAQVPLSLKNQGIWFGNRDGALVAADAPIPADSVELRALNQTGRDAYVAVLSKIVLAPDLVSQMRGEIRSWVDVFGLDPFSISLAVSTGSTSNGVLGPVYMKGNFDETLISQNMTDLSYLAVEAGDFKYFSVRGDYQGDLHDPGSLLALNRMNRVFINGDTLIVTPATDQMTAYLNLQNGNGSPITSDPGSLAVLGSIGEFTSAVVLNRKTVLEPEGDAILEYDKPADWSTLNQWEIFAAGYQNSGTEGNLTLALYYSDPVGADQDSGELTHRLTGYTTLVGERFPESPALVEGWPDSPFEACEELEWVSEQIAEGSVLTVKCPFSGDIPWWLLIDMRDLGFLIP